MGSENEWQKHLDTSLKRVQEALAKDARPQAQLLQAVIAAASTQAVERIHEKLQYKQEKWRRKEERRRAREARRSSSRGKNVPVGGVFAAFAGVAMYMAIAQPRRWWMLFVSLGFAISSAGIIGEALFTRGKKLEAAAPPGPARSAIAETTPNTSPIDQRLARVDAICEKILAAIQGGPQAVREIVHRPDKTLDGLSATCKELGRRERELRAAITDDDERRLRAERDDLLGRVAAEKDAVVQRRLDSALRALDAQLAQRAELATAASRLEAEQTRILYTLESLHTQVLRARSADVASADVAGAGLRRSLEQLGEEIDAVASALESAHGAEPVTPVQPALDEHLTGPRRRERS